MIIAVDFDGTLCKHEYPAIGDEVGGFFWLKKFRQVGATLIMYTMRSPGQKDGNVLQQAIDFCAKHDFEFDHHNCNPYQKFWTSSPKVYAKLYIDDAAFGCPLKENPGGKPYIDWDIVGPAVLQIIEEHNG
jgi:hypothetical protein